MISRSALPLAAVMATTIALTPHVAEAQPPPAIAVVGATEGLVVVKSTGPSSDVVLSLRSAQPPGEVKATVSEFRGEPGEVIQATVLPPEFNGSTGTVRISAALPFGGPYTAELTLEHDKIIDPPVNVSVTRTQTAAPVTVDGVATVSTQSTGFGRALVARRVTLTETAGRTLKLQAPMIITASQTAASQVVLADIRVADVKTEEGTTTCTLSDQLITLQPGRPCPLVVTLDMPAAAATYNATVRFGAAGYTPVDDKLTILTRMFWWRALIVLAVGILLGLVVLQVLRPALARLNARVAVAWTRVELKAAANRLAPVDEREQEVVNGLHALLDRLDEMISDYDPSGAAARLSIAQTQVGLLRPWVRVFRKWKEKKDPKLKPELDDIADLMQTLKLDANTVDGLRVRLQQLETQLDKQKAPVSDIGQQDRHRPSPEALRLRQRIARAALLAVAFVVAVLAGLATLYVPDPTWGGLEDIILGLLWGLGLTAAGTAAGFAGAYNALTK